MNEEDKLKQFLDITMEDAKAESSRAVELFESALQQTYDEYVAIQERKASLSIEHSTEKMKRDKNSETAKKQIEIRRNMSIHQDKLKTELFADVTDKLILYMASPEYMDYIIGCIDKAVAFADGAPMTVYINSSDSVLLDRIQKIPALAGLNDVTVEIAEEDFMGGVRVAIPSRNVLIDESFGSKLAQEKSKFSF